VALSSTGLLLTLAQYFETQKRANSKFSFTLTGTAVVLSALVVFEVVQLMAVSNVVPPVDQYLTNIKNANSATKCSDDSYIDSLALYTEA
jgi:hypothetical protein